MAKGVNLSENLGVQLPLSSSRLTFLSLLFSPFPSPSPGAHPVKQLGVWGSSVSSHSEVKGKAPADKQFGAYLGQKEQLWWQ